MDLGALGAAASGFTRSVVRGEDRNTARARQRTLDDRNDTLWNRQQDQFSREDEDRRLMEEANAAAADVLKGYQAEWQKQQPGPTLDGAPVAVNPFKPSPMQILEAGSARTSKLLERKGPTQAWMDSWTRDEQMRTRLRGDAAQRIRQAMTTGGDITEPLSEFYSTTAGAGKVSKAAMSRGPDGKPVVAIMVEGQQQPMMVPAEQFIMELDKTVANPADIAKHNLQMAMEAFKQKGSLEEIKARGERDVTTAKEKHTLTLGEIDRRNQGDKEVAGIRASGSRNSARGEAIRALGQERTSVDNDIRTLTQQLKDARPTDRPLIQQQLAEARTRADDIRSRLAELSAPEGSAPAPAAAPARAPGDQVMDAAMRDAKSRGLSEFTVDSKLVNDGKRTTVRIGGEPATAAAPGADKFEAGRVYRDKNGARAKYLGNGKWQPL